VTTSRPHRVLQSVQLLFRQLPMQVAGQLVQDLFAALARMRAQLVDYQVADYHASDQLTAQDGCPRSPQAGGCPPSRGSPAPRQGRSVRDPSNGADDYFAVKDRRLGRSLRSRLRGAQPAPPRLRPPTANPLAPIRLDGALSRPSWASRSGSS
jgi:hypothetical protein